MELSLQKKGLIVGLVLFVVGAVILTYSIRNKEEQEKLDVASKVFTSSDSVVSYTDTNGNPLSLESYLGSYLVVTTWASWSPFSVSDLEKLNQLALNFGDEEVVFLALNRKETREQAQRFMATLPSLENITLVIDVEDRFYLETGGYAMPETVVFDEAGQIILHQRGELQVVEIQTLLESLLAK